MIPLLFNIEVLRNKIIIELTKPGFSKNKKEKKKENFEYFLNLTNQPHTHKDITPQVFSFTTYEDFIFQSCTEKTIYLRKTKRIIKTSH